MLVANLSKFDHVSDFILSGKLGNYKGSAVSPTMIDVTSSNIMQYIGQISSGYESKITRISFKMVPPEGPWTSGDIGDLNQVDDHWN